MEKAVFAHMCCAYLMYVFADTKRKASKDKDYVLMLTGPELGVTI
jgi:hypothetical protein